jgi:perosamine synthetase
MTTTSLAIDGGEPAYSSPPPAWPLPDDEIQLALQRAYSDGSWGKYDGPNVERLVNALVETHSTEFMLPCSSGTIAVEIALRGLRLGPGDEVILGGYDFPGNFRAIEAVGAVPVLVDVEAGNWCLDPELVEAAVSPQTRALMVSHLHSGIADMQRLRAVADRHGMAVIEDACQAPGARVQGRVAGTWGDVSVLSFGGSKLLTAGRGGVVMTGREDIWQRAKIFCERGNLAFPLSELQAAVLLPQLQKLADRNATRRRNVAELLTQLASTVGVRFVGANPLDSVPSYYKLAWRFSSDECGGWSRENFIAAVQAEGISLDSGFRGFVRRGNRCRRFGTLTNSEQAASSALLLHHPVLLESEEKVQQVAVGISKVCQTARSKQNER